MSLCINPNCSQPQNAGLPLFCQSCGSKLLLQDVYRVIKFLGGGGFGKTYEIDDCGVKKVLKVLHYTQPHAIELFKQEATVLQQLNHQGIPHVDQDGYFTYQPKGYAFPLHCLVMEKIEGMNLEEYLQHQNYEPISERAALQWLKQVLDILKEVHQHNYFHRDIKPPNIMIKGDGQLALIDFGTAREESQTYMQKLQGQQITGIISPGFSPMEQINGKAVPQSDFFALGRTFVFLLTGKRPNELEEDPNTGELIWRQDAQRISAKLQDLIDDLMKPFPGNRPQTVDEILTKLSQINQKTHSSYSNNNQSSQPNSYKQTTPTTPVNSQYNKTSQVKASTSNSLQPAPLWRRFLALLIDCLFYFSFLLGFCQVFWWSNNSYPYYGSDVLFGIMCSVPLSCLYTVLTQKSKHQSTWGQRALEIKVTNLQGGKIGFWQGTWKFFLFIFFFGWSIYGVGLINFIPIWFTKDKRSLHDKMSNTIVVRKT